MNHALRLASFLILPVSLVVCHIETVSAENGSLGTISIRAGKTPLQNQPVSVDLSDSQAMTQPLHLIDPASQEKIPVQIETRDGQPSRLWLIYPDTLAAGETKTLELKTGAAPAAREVTIKDTGKAYQIM
ncbi:MAG: hypothetical protein RLO18_13805, partial [Gimesia chilikensis]